MPSFPRCSVHGIRACPCQSPYRDVGDIGSIDAALVEARAHVARLEALRQEVAARPQPPQPREMPRAEKRRAGLPRWTLDMPVTADECTCGVVSHPGFPCPVHEP